jgi:hypothetical protein
MAAAVGQLRRARSESYHCTTNPSCQHARQSAKQPAMLLLIRPIRRTTGETHTPLLAIDVASMSKPHDDHQ